MNARGSFVYGFTFATVIIAFFAAGSVVLCDDRSAAETAIMFGLCAESLLMVGFLIAFTTFYH